MGGELDAELALETAAVQLPAPFDEWMGTAGFDNGLDLETRHIVLADDRHLGKLILQEIQPTLIFVDLFDPRRSRKVPVHFSCYQMRRIALRTRANNHLAHEGHHRVGGEMTGSQIGLVRGQKLQKSAFRHFVEIETFAGQPFFDTRFRRCAADVQSRLATTVMVKEISPENLPLLNRVAEIDAYMRPWLSLEL